MFSLKETDSKGLKALAILIATNRHNPRLNKSELEDIAFDLFDRQYTQALVDAEALIVWENVCSDHTGGFKTAPGKKWHEMTTPRETCFNCSRPLENGVCNHCEGAFDAYCNKHGNDADNCVECRNS